mgnify:CR=1 FL=1|jgi:hypothetical protein
MKIILQAMEEKIIGLLETTVNLVKRDPEMEAKLMQKHSIPEDKADKVRSMLRYNHWTVQQFSDISGLALSTIANLTRPSYKDGKLTTSLDYAYPFADLEGDGPKFIVRNEKSEKYLPDGDI